MQFTYEAYSNLIDKIKTNNYEICDYNNYMQYDKCCILRHDIDYSLERAGQFAELENRKDVKSTYFILLSSDFYNLASKKSQDAIKHIQSCGHNIGLHFDEKRYTEAFVKESGGVNSLILKEAGIMSDMIDAEVNIVSMHRPSKQMIYGDLKINGLVNVYSGEFFKSFKYISDSRMKWREDVESIVESNAHKRLHILTHAFWYFEKNKSMNDIITEFIRAASEERYVTFKENITDLDSIIGKVENK